MKKQNLFGDCATPEEALVTCASHFKLENLEDTSSDVRPLTETMRDSRAAHYDTLKEDFTKKLRQAEWLQRNNGGRECQQYNALKVHVADNAFGDTDVQSDLASMIAYAEANYSQAHRRLYYLTQEEFSKEAWADINQTAKEKKAGVKISDSNRAYKLLKSRPILEEVGARRDEQARKVTKALRKLAAELVSQKRSHRLFETVHQFEELATSLRKDSGAARCLSCDKCGAETQSLQELSGLTKCGHKFCSACIVNLEGDCGSSVCSASYSAHEIFPAVDFAIEDARRGSGKRYGRKIEELVQMIKSIPNDEQVLLFVQFSAMTRVTLAALEVADIKVACLANSNNPAKILTNFQANDDPRSRVKVLMLNIGDSSAAGS